MGGGTTISGTPSYNSTSGKIGNGCLNTSNMITIYEPTIADKKVCTFAFWAYITSSLVTSNWTLVARIRDKGTNSGSNLRFEVCPKNNYNGVYCFSNHNNSGNAITDGVITSKSGGYYDQWVHFCFTSDGTTLTRYMNGEKEGTCTYNGPGYFSGYFDLANNNLCFKQDVRIYDHCLSSKEVKELSKGLVCHYKLNNGGLGGENFILESHTVTSGVDASGITSTYMSDGSLKIVSTSGNSNYRSCGFAKNSNTNVGAKLSVGDTYTISVDIKVEEGTVLPTLFINGGNGYKALKSVTGSIPKGSWFRAYYTSTWNDPGTSYGNISPHLGFSSAIGTYYFKNFKLEKGAVPTQWCPSPSDDIKLGVDSTTEVDCSGYINNGTKSGNITCVGTSSRYDTCYNFPSDAYIVGNAKSKVTDEITVSIWCYMSTWAVDPHPVSCTESGGWNFESSNSKVSFPLYVSGVGYKSATSSKLWSDLSSGWHMLTGTYDGLTVKLYIDGVLEASTSNGQSTKTPIGYNSSNTIFLHGEATSSNTIPNTGYKACSLSDFRIYATALSDSEVKELYNTSASIDKLGNFYSYEFKEE